MSLTLLGQGRNFSVTAHCRVQCSVAREALMDAQGCWAQLSWAGSAEPRAAPCATTPDQSLPRALPGSCASQELQKLDLFDNLLETLKQHSL